MTQQKTELSQVAHAVLEHRFLKKNDQGSVTETPEQFFRRIARNIAQAEIKYKLKDRINRILKKHDQPEEGFWWLLKNTGELDTAIKKDKDVKSAEEEFTELLTSLDFIPSPSILRNASSTQQCASELALESEDSIDGIFSTLQDASSASSKGTKVTVDFSNIRPEGSITKNNMVATGPASFTHIFNTAARELQAGSPHHIATYVALSITHPDIHKFLSDYTMPTMVKPTIVMPGNTVAAIKKGTSIAMTDPHTGKMVDRHDADQLFTSISSLAAHQGTRSFFFADNANKHNPIQKEHYAVAPTQPNTATVAGSINLAHMAKEGEIDWEHLKKRIHTAVRFLDNTIDITDYGNESIEQQTHELRPIALGIIGFADLLARLKMRYGTDKSIEIAAKVAAFMSEEATAASVQLAKERGTFPSIRKSKYAAKKAPRVRNATRIFITPDKTAATIAGCTRGIQPLAAIARRHVLNGKEMIEINPQFVAATKQLGVYSSRLIEQVMEKNSLKGAFVAVSLKKVFVTEQEIAPEAQLRTQEAFQKEIDGIASYHLTLTNPDPEQIKDILINTHAAGCAALTITSRLSPL